MKMTRRQLHGRVGGLTNFARHGGEAMSAPARVSANSKLDARLIAEYGLADVAEPEHSARLAAARSAHFTQLALKRRKTA